jgi:LysM repeat protein
MQEVLPNDSLIVMVQRCGHRDLAVIDLVLELNNLEQAEYIQIGQILEIPWPTATPDPNEQAAPTVEGESSGEGEPSQDTSSSGAVAVNLSVTRVDPTATLQPGVQWHQVVLGEDIISIAQRYGANIRIMSELNPQVTFSQCDFGAFGGGAQCIVQIYEGQFLRVPAPTPLPTLSPTPSGSETPTPTATATFNAPSALSPDNRMLFRSAEFVTLRWVASGSLAPEQTYRVRVEDLTTGTVYSGDTLDLFFIIPQEWQGRDSRRHEYEWSVSVIDLDNPDDPYFTTETRTFTWEAQE